MRIADFGLVDVLAAGAAGAHGVDAQVAGVDRDIDLLGFGQHGDGAAEVWMRPCVFGRRHALHAVGAGFELQPGEHALAVIQAMISL